MESTWRQIGISIKKKLLNRDKSLEIEAVSDIKKYLHQSQTDIEFVQVILELDIHEFLLDILISLKYPLILNVLECLEYLCSYKIYFESQQAVPTAEIILKSNYFLIKNNSNYDDYLSNSIKLLRNILIRLNHYPQMKSIMLSKMLSSIHEILKTKNNCDIISMATLLLGAFLSYDALFTQINEVLLIEIETVCKLSITKLAVYSEKKETFIAICTICDNSLSFSKKLNIYENKNILKFTNEILDISVKCLAIICIPFAATTYDYVAHLPTEYLCFLESLINADLPTEMLYNICKKLVKEKNFNIFAKYINVCDSESRECIKQFCLTLIVKIIVCLTPIEHDFWPYSEDKYSKYLSESLQIVPNNVDNWLSLLENDQVNFDSKLSIILFSSIYYGHSDNAQEMKSSHLCHLVSFLNNIPYSTNLPEILMKDLWFLFAVYYSSFLDETTKIHGIRKASNVLQRLLFAYIDSLENIVIYHSSIIYWVCLSPGVKKQLKLEVFGIWLLKCHNNEICRLTLLSAIKKSKTASTILLHLAKIGLPKYALPATKILRLALQLGYLVHHQTIMDNICSYISSTITELSSKHMVRERVVNAVYMLQLGSYVYDINNIEIIRYFVTTFTKFIGKVGLDDKLPSIFYVKAFEYTNGIMGIAKQHKINHVFLTLLNSDRTVHVFLRALTSENQSLSVESSKIIIKLLQYQIKYTVQSKNYLSFDKRQIINLLSTSDENQLILNLQLVKYLFKLIPKNRILNVLHRIDKNFINGLYLRCVCLMANPCLVNYIFECLLSLLNYTQQDKSTDYNYLWDHPANFTIIYLYCDRETSRPLEKPFLHFVQRWLMYVVTNEQAINKLSISYILWVTSVNRIANLFKVNTLNSENSELIHNIVNQLLVFGDLLPAETIHYLL